MIAIQITEKGHGNQWWKELLSLYLKEGNLLKSTAGRMRKKKLRPLWQYGTLEDTNWEYGEVIKGMLTAELIRELLEWKCTEEDVYEKLTHILHCRQETSAVSITAQKFIWNRNRKRTKRFSRF